MNLEPENGRRKTEDGRRKLLRTSDFGLPTFYLLIALLAYGCAQQVGPTGGAKDTTPPKIKASEPQNFSTGFTGNKIVLRFDEFVQLKELQNKIVISPPLKETPVFRIRGKMLEITFSDTLHANTTYNFNFGDGIVDVNESNPLDSNLFVFSTGNKIDSLLVKGTLKNAFNLTPEKQMIVMLYPAGSDDSIPYLSHPVYFTKAKDDGSFKIQYAKEGDYKLFALKDGNGNYRYDLPTEKIGFLENPVVAGDSVLQEVFLFEEDVSKQFMKRGYAEHFGKLVFVFTKNAENSRAVPLNRSFKKAWYIEELSAKKDTLIYWLTGTEGLDTLSMQVLEGNEILDTALEIILPKKEDTQKSTGKGRGKAGFPQKLILSSNVKAGQPFDLFSALQIESIHPVKNYDASRIILTEKKDTVKFTIENTDKALRKFEIKYKWKESTEYKLFVPPNVFSDIYDLTNDTLKLSFKTRKEDDYYDINLKIDLPETDSLGKESALGPQNDGLRTLGRSGQYIVQLMDMDAKEKVLNEKIIGGKTDIKFEHLLPGKFKLKMIYDVNSNSKWDTGNYLQHRQPEKVIYYSAPVELRPKFDLDVDWKMEK